MCPGQRAASQVLALPRGGGHSMNQNEVMLNVKNLKNTIRFMLAFCAGLWVM